MLHSVKHGPKTSFENRPFKQAWERIDEDSIINPLIFIADFGPCFCWLRGGKFMGIRLLYREGEIFSQEEEAIRAPIIWYAMVDVRRKDGWLIQTI